MKLGDLHPCEPLNKEDDGKRYATDTDVKQAVNVWSQTLETNFFYGKIKALVGQTFLCEW
jgi:hypothetical protein